MAPKKKNAKNKPNESPEERALRIEREAAEAAERMRLQMEANRFALQARQAREQKYSKFNSIKIHNQWRKIMRMSKVDELRTEIEVLSQSHEREVDRKDALIQMLDRDLEDSEEQYCMAVNGFMEVVTQIKDLQHQRVKEVMQDFERQLRALDEEFTAERVDTAAAYAQHRKDLLDMSHALQAEFNQLESEIRQEFESQREEIKNKSSEEYNVMKITLESNISDLEKKFEVSHEAYLLQTADHTATFQQLTRTDAEAARIIEMRSHKLQRMQDALTYWKDKLASNNLDWERRNRELRQEKAAVGAHYHALKASLDACRGARQERLQTLSVNAKRCEDTLRTRLTDAERLLKLAELCRKLETEQEKVIPFHSVPDAVIVDGERVVTADVEEELRESEALLAADGKPEAGGGEGLEAGASVSRTEREGDEDLLDVVPDHKSLDGFFRRMNKVILDKCAVDREAARLTRENEDLRMILKQYLDGISVNEDVLRNPVNPLLVVNNRLQFTLKERDKARATVLSQKPAAPGKLAVALGE